MSHDVLVADLREKSEERVRQNWQVAEEKVDEIRLQKSKELERRTAEVQRSLESEAELVAAPILHDAQRKAMTIEDDAMQDLSRRLYLLAVDMLGKVRQKDYEVFFADMVSELPSIDWEQVRVNPADTELAKSMFSGAEIEADGSIKGGFEASADGGKYRVVNLLEKRLEKRWFMTLPRMIQEISGEGDEGAAL